MELLSADAQDDLSRRWWDKTYCRFGRALAQLYIKYKYVTVKTFYNLYSSAVMKRYIY